ncbi:MAG: TIGR02996 domain-containing protein [Archangium sp.]|nr:TIGR02996 domain-containing protein [Archangium sp.]
MASRRDDWLLQIEAKSDLGPLLAEVMDTSLPRLEARLLTLAMLPPQPAIARVAEDFFATFPVRFREQLGAACAAVGVAWLHRAKPAAFTKLPKLEAPNAQVNAWYQLVPAALSTALGPRGRPRKSALTPLPRGPRAALQEAWLARAASGAAEQLPALLERFAEGPSTDVAARAVALLSFPVDARIADAAVAFLERPSVRVSAEVPLFTVLALLLCVHGHRGNRKAVERFVGELPSLGWLEAALPGVTANAVTAPEPRKSDSPRNESDFLRYLAEAPRDDARRALFTDWLLEQGSPRGEFMALQRSGRPLTPKETKRVGALQKKHEREWLGSLHGGHRKGTARYVDGVLCEIELSMWRGSEVPPSDEPRLATLKRLELDGGTNLPLGAMFAAPVWHRLESLTAPLWVLEQVPAPLLESLEELGLVEPSLADQRKPFDFLAARALPKLRSLRLVGQWWRDVAAFERLPQRAQLERVEVETTTPELWFPQAAHLARLDVLPGTSKYSEEGQRRFRFHFVRGQPLRITVPRTPPPESLRERLLGPLARVPEEARRDAVLELPGDAVLTGETRAAFELLTLRESGQAG